MSCVAMQHGDGDLLFARIPTLLAYRKSPAARAAQRYWNLDGLGLLNATRHLVRANNVKCAGLRRVSDFDEVALRRGIRQCGHSYRKVYSPAG